MQEISTVTIAGGSYLPRAGTIPDVNTSLGPTESTPPTAPDPIQTAGVDTLPAPTVAPPKLPNRPASDVLTTEAVGGASEPPTPKLVQRIKGGPEAGRISRMELATWNPEVAVEAGDESSLERIKQRAVWVCRPFCATPAPSAPHAYGTTEELFSRIQTTIAQQALVTERASSLLAFWSLSTWFADALPLAPILGISGSAEEGDRVLRSLRALCHFSQLKVGINISDLKTIDWRFSPTLLFNEPNLTKKMATFLGCSTMRGYLQGRWKESKDLYGSKAIYLGEYAPVDRKLPWSIQVNAMATTATAARTLPPLTDAAVETLQNQILGYRLSNLIKVENSSFDVPGLPADVRPVANALGACVVGSLKLQNELISLLAPQVEQRLADRSSSLEGMTIEAILSLSHQGKSKILAAEIAVAVNVIAKARGERLEFKPENIGHTLKNLSLFTTRLGKAGRGLVVDQATLIRVHEIAEVYGGVGLDQDENNLHCPLCAEKKRVM